MDASKIEKFIDAGYTKEEINLLFKDPKIDPKPEQKNDPKPQPDPEPDKADANQQDPMIEINNTIKTLTDTVTSLSDTVKAMQQSNINNATTDTSKKDSLAEVMQSFVEKL